MIIKPEVEEIISPDMSMREAVMFLALKKALSVEQGLPDEDIPHPSLIIAADTVVYSGKIIGKPDNFEEAYAILEDLNGKSHYVATGIALIEPHGFKRKVFCEVTKVYFKKYSKEDIQRYIETEEPYDKAGGYAIQGAWGKHVDRIEGDYDNVIGFPFNRILKEIEAL